MNEKEKRIEELLRNFHEMNKEMERRGFKKERLEADVQGRLILDPNTPVHVAWLYNDGEYYEDYAEMMKDIWIAVNFEEEDVFPDCFPDTEKEPPE